MASDREAVPRVQSRSALSWAVLLLWSSLRVTSLAAQQGEAWATAVGGSLGFFSGALTAEVGAIGPCNQTRWGVRCVQLSAGAGGTLGLAAGAYAGFRDAAVVGRAALGAAVGFGVGTVGGVIVRPLAERLGWHDVATLGVVGASVGAAFPGSLIGLGAGGVAGVLAWQLLPAFERANVVSAALVGLAVGGLAQWIARCGAGPASDPAARSAIPFGVTLEF